MAIPQYVINSVSTMNYPSTSVKLNEFFMSWNSTITVSYTGFSQTLLDIKQYLDGNMDLNLKPENPGAKWPKTTLGCLQDSKQLRPSHVRTIRDICDKFNPMLQELGNDGVMQIDKLSVVEFGSRTLESVVSQFEIPLKGTATNDDPPASHLDFVKGVMNQFAPGELPHYYPFLVPEGRSIDEYYRKPHVELTLVAWVTWSDRLKDLVDDFIWELDSALEPDSLYAWFKPKSRHLTIRGLV